MTTKKASLLIPVIVLLFVLTAIPWGRPAPAAHAAPPWQAPTEKPSVSAGQLLWGENCLPCHGPAGRGDGPTAQSLPAPPPDFSNPQLARQYVPADLFNTVKEGRMEKMMPPWKERLSDAEIWNAVAYVWRLGTSVQNLAAGQTIYQENCLACHGPAGQGDGPDAPAEMVNLADLQMMSQKSQASLFEAYTASDQHAGLSGLPEEAVWQALDYVRTFSFETTIPSLNGVLRGQVINATTGQPVGGVEVTLHVVQNNIEIDVRTTQADESGAFTFEKLSTEHSVLYFLEGQYQNIRYTSDEPAVFTPDSEETTLNLNVYDTTTSPDDVFISQLHYLVSFTPDVVQVAQIFVLGNSGNLTYVGENGQTVPVPLPAGATDIEFQDNPGQVRFTKTETGYVDTRPVPPGPETSSVVALYNMPYDDDTLTIELPVPLQTRAVNVLMSSQGAELTSDQVQFRETRQAQGSEFLIYTGDGLNAGDTLVMTLTNLDNLTFEGQDSVAGSGSGDMLDQSLLRWVVLALGALAVLAAGAVYPSLRQKAVPVPVDDPDTARQRLVLLLARLDEAFEAGELDETVYRQARSRYKAELARLMEAGAAE